MNDLYDHKIAPSVGEIERLVDGVEDNIKSNKVKRWDCPNTTTDKERSPKVAQPIFKYPLILMCTHVVQSIVLRVLDTMHTVIANSMLARVSRIYIANISAMQSRGGSRML